MLSGGGRYSEAESCLLSRRWEGLSTGAPQSHWPWISSYCPCTVLIVKKNSPCSKHNNCPDKQAKAIKEGLKRAKIRKQTKQPRNEINIHNGRFCLQKVLIHGMAISYKGLLSRQQNEHLNKISGKHWWRDQLFFPKAPVPGPRILFKETFKLLLLGNIIKVVSPWAHPCHFVLFSSSACSCINTKPPKKEEEKGGKKKATTQTKKNWT